MWVEAFHVFQGAVCCHSKVSIPRGQEIKNTRVEINVLHLQLFPAALLRPLYPKNPNGTVGRCLCLWWKAGLAQLLKLQPKCRRRGRQRKMPRLVNALSARTAIQTQLQILGGVVGLSELLWDPDRQRQVSTQLANDHSHTDVASVQFHVATGAPFKDPQSPDFDSRTIRVSRKLDGFATAHCSIVKGCRKVVRARLVDLLVCTTLVGLEDDGDLDRDTVRNTLQKYL